MDERTTLLKRFLIVVVAVIFLATAMPGSVDVKALGGDAGVSVVCNCFGECEWVP